MTITAGPAGWLFLPGARLGALPNSTVLVRRPQNCGALAGAGDPANVPEDVGTAVLQAGEHGTDLFG